MDVKATISLKALVDKENNRVILVESNKDFVDVLLSFLTMPLGTIIGLTRNEPPNIGIGCMTNLYESVENLDVSYFRTPACKTLLLHPKNGAVAQCTNLSLKIDKGESLSFFHCGHWLESDASCRQLSYYENVLCASGHPMRSCCFLSQPEGVFIKGMFRFVVGGDLNVKPAFTSESLSLLSNYGVKNVSALEVKTFDIGTNELLALLKCSLVSETPLTDALLQQIAVPEPVKVFDHHFSARLLTEELQSEENAGIRLRLILSKSRKMLCYAEVREDFVNLLFSFLTTPLGYVSKVTDHGTSIGCINHLYKSLQGLDAEEYLMSEDIKEILISPKTANGFGFENHRLGVKEVSQQYLYHYNQNNRCGHRDRAFSTTNKMDGFSSCVPLTLLDPTVQSASTTNKMDGFSSCVPLTLLHPTVQSANVKTDPAGRGLIIGPAVFTVTDDLIIRPASPVTNLSLLDELKVHYSDVEERVVHMGTEEALNLLMASLCSQSVLTSTFLREKTLRKRAC